MREALKVYRLTPNAPCDDPNWQNSLIQGEVVVRAISPGDARLVAAEAEGDFPDLAAKPAEGISTNQSSAFLNEKLYTVILEEDADHTGPCDRGVIDGRVNTLAEARWAKEKVSTKEK